MDNKKLLGFCVFFVLYNFALGGVILVEHSEHDENDDHTLATHPCPCTDQPEGIVIPHPSDCRAYYTCQSSNHVKYSRCGAGDQFFHPYLRTCVQRSKYLFFIPNIVETKDLCKINSVFRAAAAENFEHCHIISEDEPTTGSSSAEDIYTNDVEEETFTAATNVELQFHWPTTNVTTLKPEETLQSTTLPAPTTTTTETSTPEIPSTSPPSASSPVDCKMAKLIVHHYPGPCTAEITCKNGASFSVNNCLNTLTFISQYTPGTSN